MEEEDLEVKNLPARYQGDLRRPDCWSWTCLVLRQDQHLVMVRENINWSLRNSSDYLFSKGSERSGLKDVTFVANLDVHLVVIRVQAVFPSYVCQIPFPL